MLSQAMLAATTALKCTADDTAYKYIEAIQKASSPTHLHEGNK